MASVLKVDKLDPQSGTALEIGTSGDTITVPVGATTSLDGAVTVNDSSNDVDFRVESNGDANALFVQGEYGFVGLGQGTPRKMLHITEASSDCTLILDTNGTTTDTQICFAEDYGTGGETGGNYWAVGIDGSENELNIAFDADSQASLGGGDSLLAIDSAGDVTVNSGNLVMGTAGKGIDFSATSDGSGTATSELFDDYEEGTWSPTLVNSAGSSLASDYTQDGTTAGKYTKIGNIVHVQFYWGGYSSSALTTSIHLGGLPYATEASPFGGHASNACGGYNWDTNNTSTLIAGVNTSHIDMLFRSTAGIQNLGNNTLTMIGATTCYCYGSLTYKVA